MNLKMILIYQLLGKTQTFLTISKVCFVFALISFAGKAKS